MTTTAVRRVVSIRIESIAPPSGSDTKHQQIKFFCDDLGFKQFAGPTRVPVADIAVLQTSPGPHQVVLERGALKRDKTGQYDNDYFWEWRGFAEPHADDELPPGADEYEQRPAQRQQAPQDDAPEAAWDGTCCPPGMDARNYSIEMQVLFKEAHAQYQADLMRGENSNLLATFDEYRDTWFQVVYGFSTGPEDTDDDLPF